MSILTLAELELVLQLFHNDSLVGVILTFNLKTLDTRPRKVKTRISLIFSDLIVFIPEK